MKRTLRFLLGLLLLAAPAAAQAQFTYTTNKGAITLVQYTGEDGAVVISNFVTRIEDRAFADCSTLTNVTIPDSVASIGGDAFVDCTNLAAITIGSGLTDIEADAFYDCTSLTSVYFQGNAPSAAPTVFAGDGDVTIHFLPGTSDWGPTFAGINSTQVTYRILDPPSGASTTRWEGISGSNIVGWYWGADNYPHGFLYNGSSYTTLVIPNGTIDANGSEGNAIAIDGGNIVGAYVDGSGNVHGFLYNGSVYTTLDDPNADPANFPYGTTLCGISGSNIVGEYSDGNGVIQGFLYNGAGYKTLADPNADPAYGTRPTGISGNNIVGIYWDNYITAHGFLYDGSTYFDLDDPIPYSISGSNIIGLGGNKSFFGGFAVRDGALYSTGYTVTVGGNDISGYNIVGNYDDNRGQIATVNPNFTITVSATPCMGGLVTGEGVFASGDLQAVSAAVNSGYTFANWTENGIVVSSSPTYSFILSSNLNLVANFTGHGAGGSYETLDAPNGVGSTFALGVSDCDFVGNYGGGCNNGFLDSSGNYTTLDVPSSNANFTIATGISGGNIVGWYTEATAAHGFLYANGNFTTLDEPNAAASAYPTAIPPGGYGYLLFESQFDGWGGTFASGVDGTNIVGWYVDTNGYTHGFLYKGGAFTTLDAPNGIGSTFAQGISGRNIVGFYTDGSGKTHGFLYNGSTYTTLDDPDGVGSTYAQGIDGNNIVGWYVNNTTGDHGFVYNGATYTTLDVPNALGGGSTFAQAISGSTVVGWYSDGDGHHHGFAYTMEPSEKFTIIVSASLSAGGKVSGGGTFASGSSNTVTATANSGYTFVNWTENGNVVSSSASYGFTLNSNMNLVANFVVKGNPKLTITSPQSGQRWSNAVFLVTGTVTDKVAVDAVYYQLNTNSWTLATPSISWSNWTASVTLSQSANTISAFVLDASGTFSTTNSVTFKYIPSATLTVRSNGNGGITPVDNGKLLAIGTNYTLTASPAKNWLFSNWVGGTALPYSVLSISSNYTFAMQSNLVLQANFVTNPFLAVAGTYSGLFYPTNGVTEAGSGFVSVAIASNSAGAYTAKLLLDGGSNYFSGSFDLTGAARANLARSGKTPVSVTLMLDLNPADALMGGTVSNAAGWNSVIHADRAVFSAAANPATNYAGQFTLLLPHNTNAPLESPDGYGYATVTNTLAGISTFGGALADGTPFLGTAPIARNGGIPFYQSLYSGAGSLLGWIYFTNEPPQKLSGNSWVSWIKPPVPNTLYPLGFTNLTGVLGSPYTNTAKTGGPALNLTSGTLLLRNGNLTNGTLIFTNIGTNKSSHGALTNLEAGTKLGPTNYLAIAVNATNGLVTVTFQPTGLRTNTVAHGAELQNQTNAAGYFLGTNETGAFILAPH
jgi:hypothetical protein